MGLDFVCGYFAVENVSEPPHSGKKLCKPIDILVILCYYVSVLLYLFSAVENNKIFFKRRVLL